MRLRKAIFSAVERRDLNTFPRQGLVYYNKLEGGEPGKFKESTRFSGGSSLIFPRPEGLSTQASVNFWVKRATGLGNNTTTGIAYINASSSNNHYGYSNNSDYWGILTSVRKQIITNVPADRTQWVMVTITANQDTDVWKLYYDSVLNMTSTVGTLTFYNNFEFGKNTAYHLDGWLDELAIWNRDITQEEVTQIYNGGEGSTNVSNV